MFILDTNVISELRKLRSVTDANVLAWASAADVKRCYVSPITLMELELGVVRMERRDFRQGHVLRSWLNDHIFVEYRNRILPINAAVAMRCAQLHVPDPRPENDAWIAATALEHGMTVVTRDLKDFAPMGVRLLNPWEQQR